MPVLMSRPGRGLCFGLLAPIALMGCEATLKGQPRTSLNENRPSLNTIVIEGTLSQQNIVAALQHQTEGNRNAIILARIAELDTLYNEYENTLLYEARQSGFLLSFTGALAGLAGSQASAAASQNYSLLSGGINAAQSSYEKEVLAEQTMNALISQMRAERARVLGEIYDKLRSPIGRYPMQAAISDLERYRQAGTLATGLVAMNQASAQRAEVETAAAARKVESFTTGRVTNVVRRPAGPDFQAPVVTERTAIDRLNAISASMQNGEITAEKVAVFLNTLPVSDPVMRGELQSVADGIKQANSQDEVRAADLNPGLIGGVASIFFSNVDEETVEELEAALTQ